MHARDDLTENILAICRHNGTQNNWDPNSHNR